MRIYRWITASALAVAGIACASVGHRPAHVADLASEPGFSAPRYTYSPARYLVGAPIQANFPLGLPADTSTSWSIDPALPDGLALDPASGAISGTPTAAKATSRFTVTAATASASTPIALDLEVTSPAPPEQSTAGCASFPHLEYFGYYSYYHGFPNGFDLAPLADHSNLIMLWNEPHRFEHLAELQAAHRKAITEVTSAFFATPFTGALVPNYQEQWDALAKQLAPYRDSIASFYAEELYWYPVFSARNANPSVSRKVLEGIVRQNNQSLATMIATVKATFPEIKFTLADTDFIIRGGPLGKICPTCAGLVDLPPNLDWLGLETYPNTAAETKQYLAVFDAAERILKPGQRLLLVPPAFGGKTSAEMQGPDDAVENAKIQVMIPLITRIQTDTNFIGVLAYFWLAPDAANTGPNGIGNWPSSPLRKLYHQVGRCILAPSAPSDLKVAADSSTSASASWASTGTGYFVGYAQGDKPPACTIDAGSATTYALTGLAPATPVTFSVCAVNAKGFLSEAKAVSVATPPL